MIEARSTDNVVHDGPVDIGQPKIPSGITIRQLVVIQSQQMQEGGVQIVHMYFVFDRFMPKLVGLAVSKPRLDSTAGQPNRKSAWIVIAPIPVL